MFVTFKSFRSKLIPNFPPFWACKLMDSSCDASCFQEMNELFEDIIIILLVAYHHRIPMWLFFFSYNGIFFVGSRPLYYNTSLQNVYTQGWWTSSSFYIAPASMSVSSSTLSLKNRWESSGTHVTLSLRIIYCSFHSFLNILISSDSDYVPESEAECERFIGRWNSCHLRLWEAIEEKINARKQVSPRTFGEGQMMGKEWWQVKPKNEQTDLYVSFCSGRDLGQSAIWPD